MEFFLFAAWVALTWLGGWVWEHRGLSFATGFLISFLFTPLIGIIFGLMKEAKPQGQKAKK